MGIWRRLFTAVSAVALGFSMLAGRAVLADADQSAWQPLISRDSFTGWQRVGEADWRVEEGVFSVGGHDSSSFLVSEASYRDFHLRVDFRAKDSTNSGVFLRCSDIRDITPFTCYEINISADHTNPDNRTGSIVTLAPPVQVVPTSGQWNTFEIRAEGERLSVILNGIPVSAVLDDRFVEGPLALQFREGEVAFRNAMIRILPEYQSP